MNTRSLEVLKKIYKPYKYTIQGKVYILKSTSGDVVLKESNKDIKKLYNYLDTCGFSNYPKLIEERVGINVYEYLQDNPMPEEQKIMDYIRLVANLHKKTSYKKEVSLDNFKEIYDLIKDKIIYLTYYYEKLFDEYFENVYPSPSMYLFLRNYYKINGSLKYSLSKLEEWFSKVKDKKTMTLAIVNHNLGLEHFSKGNDKDYILNFEHYTKDSPILDIIEFYKKYYDKFYFSDLLKEYLKINYLDEEDMLLFIVNITIPEELVLKGNEFEKTNMIKNLIEYVDKTEELVRPYNTKEKVKE